MSHVIIVFARQIWQKMLPSRGKSDLTNNQLVFR